MAVSSSFSFSSSAAISRSVAASFFCSAFWPPAGFSRLGCSFLNCFFSSACLARAAWRSRSFRARYSSKGQRQSVIFPSSSSQMRVAKREMK